jgi:hypothetical protein
MRRRLAKEIRQLAPWPAAATVLLFAVPPFVGDEDRIWRLFFPLYLVLAVFAPAARVFGGEFDQGTVERLLSQPIARLRIWREKLLALGLTTAVAFAALQLARHLFLGKRLDPLDDVESSLGLDLVMCLVALSGGPLVSLYCRQSFLALWGAISLPAAPMWIWLFLLYLTLGHFHVGFFWVHIPPMIVYVPVAYVLARRLFLNLELDQVSSRRLNLPGWLRIRPGSTFGPTTRLVLKEIQLQASNLLVVPTVLLLWGVVYGLALIAEPQPSLLARSLAIFRALLTSVLIFIFPLLLGGTALAAERQMGLTDWHCSLPVSRSRQWWVKVLVVMSLALAGGALGSYLDRLLFTVLEARRLGWSPLPPGTWLSILAAAVGVYASSRAREPFRAVMGGVALLALTLVPATSSTAIQMRGAGLRSFFFPHLPGAEMYLGITLPTLALLAFAFANFRPEPWLWERNGGRVVRCLVLGGLLLAIGFW